MIVIQLQAQPRERPLPVVREGQRQVHVEEDRRYERPVVRLTEPPLRDSQPERTAQMAASRSTARLPVAQPPVAQPASPSHTADDPPGARACQHRGRTRVIH
jgi:hypothetical protein